TTAPIAARSRCAWKRSRDRREAPARRGHGTPALSQSEHARAVRLSCALSKGEPPLQKREFEKYPSKSPLRKGRLFGARGRFSDPPPYEGGAGGGEFLAFRAACLTPILDTLDPFF